MNRSIKHYLMLGAILTGIPSMGQTGLAGIAEPELKIILHVYDDAHVGSETLTRAEEETTQIYREIGVETLWIEQPLLPEKEQHDPPRHPALDIYLKILPRAMKELGLPDRSLAIAPGVGRNRHLAYVFYDRVEDLSRKQIVAVAQGKVRRWATAAQILGYAMAHEIGHLFGLDGHSSAGIMRAGWRWNDLLELAYGDLVFTPQQASIIRTEVRIRQQKVFEVAEPH